MNADSLEVRIVRLEESNRAADIALRMQAQEYERRLQTLNHEHARLAEERALTVSTEKFEGYEKDMGTWRDAVNKALNELQGHSVGTSASRQLLFQVLPLVVALAALIVAIIK